MNRKRWLLFSADIFVSIILFGFLILLSMTYNQIWIVPLLAVWTIVSLYRRYDFLSKAEPELLAVPKEANKGLWKSILAFFLATFIVTVAYTYFQFPAIYVQYIAIGLGVLFTGYILWRHFKAFRKAKLAVKSRKALEATSKNMNHE